MTTTLTHTDALHQLRRWVLAQYSPSLILCEPQRPGGSEQPDLFAFCGVDQTHVFEVKLSNSDFHGDEKKAHRDGRTKPMGNYRWYVTGPNVKVNIPHVYGHILLLKNGELEINQTAFQFFSRNRDAELLLIVQACRNMQVASGMTADDARRVKRGAMTNKLRDEICRLFAGHSDTYSAAQVKTLTGTKLSVMKLRAALHDMPEVQGDGCCPEYFELKA